MFAMQASEQSARQISMTDYTDPWKLIWNKIILYPPDSSQSPWNNIHPSTYPTTQKWKSNPSTTATINTNLHHFATNPKLQIVKMVNVFPS